MCPTRVIIDAIFLIKSNVHATVINKANHSSALIFLACDPDNRYMYPNSFISFGIPWTDENSTKKEERIKVKVELKRIRDIIIKMVSKHTNLSINETVDLFLSNKKLNQEETISYGIPIKEFDKVQKLKIWLSLKFKK